MSECRQDFLLKHGFWKAKPGRIFKTVLAGERHSIEGVFEPVQGFMIAVWPKLQQRVRLVMEYKIKAPLERLVWSITSRSTSVLSGIIYVLNEDYAEYQSPLTVNSGAPFQTSFQLAPRRTFWMMQGSKATKHRPPC